MKSFTSKENGYKEYRGCVSDIVIQEPQTVCVLSLCSKEGELQDRRRGETEPIANELLLVLFDSDLK